MKAMVLAAGRGERMRPLTDRLPKSLLQAGGKPLIVRHVEKLAAAGFTHVVINHAHLGHLIEAELGDGGRFGITIDYSAEKQALETAGGVALALPKLGTEPFAVINADVYSDYDYSRLREAGARPLSSGALAYLVLVDNPEHHAQGDFALHEGRLSLDGAKLTFSGLGVYRCEFFAHLQRGEHAKLAPLLYANISRIVGEHYVGRWCDVGTPSRLAQLNAELAAGPARRERL